LFHGPVLTFWQTAGLFLLSKILLTGVAPGGHSGRYKKDWHHRYYEKYRGYCEEKRDEGQGTSDEGRDKIVND
jgi:hypothetical protein